MDATVSLWLRNFSSLYAHAVDSIDNFSHPIVRMNGSSRRLLHLLSTKLTDKTSALIWAVSLAWSAPWQKNTGQITDSDPRHQNGTWFPDEKRFAWYFFVTFYYNCTLRRPACSIVYYHEIVFVLYLCDLMVADFIGILHSSRWGGRRRRNRLGCHR